VNVEAVTFSETSDQTDSIPLDNR